MKQNKRRQEGEIGKMMREITKNVGFQDKFEKSSRYTHLYGTKTGGEVGKDITH